MEWKAKWIKPQKDYGDVAPLFGVSFAAAGKVAEAKLYITAMGVYEASLNGKRVGDFVLAPGWTSYWKRLQYQEYDVTKLLQEENRLEVLVGKGWYRSPMGWRGCKRQEKLCTLPAGLLAQLMIRYEDGSSRTVCSDETWKVSGSRVRFSEIYDGEIYDATVTPGINEQTECFQGPEGVLIPQQGESIREQERLKAARVFTTPAGETVVDFGQNLTGYVEINVSAASGETVDLSFAEVLDKDGNFYNANYRTAKSQYRYTCRDGQQTWHPKQTFYGFRYARINSFPGGAKKAAEENFTAIAVYSDMKRTGRLSCSDPQLNQLFSNIIWGQKGNFVDVPTDCPQRNERLGWTGDAQAFVRAACLNFDAEKFYTKWLTDMVLDQREDGCVGHVIPDILQARESSSAWGDAAAICPWTVYLIYGDPEILRRQFDCMKGWVDYITSRTTRQYLWTGGEQLGDWLGLDAPSGSYTGSSRKDFIATAFYAYSTSLLVKAGKVLGKDISSYESLYQNIVKTFRETYPTYLTQTECVLAAHFQLATDCQAAADQLAQMVTECGGHLQTGFVGTPYLLHVLSDYGYASLAYTLLLRREYPSWLYAVTKGATTVWEHWDGIMENGDFWSPDMNSFNHYAYGAVADWVYGTAAGICPLEEAPGFAKVRIAPVADERLDWLKAELDTRHGHISSGWKKAGGMWRYEITTPVEAEIVIAKETHQVQAGSYVFYSAIARQGETE